MCFSTIGREIHPGHEVKICCLRDAGRLENDCLGTRFRIVMVKDGFGIFTNGEISQLITAPAILCLNEAEEVHLADSNGLSLDMIFFHPTCFDESITFENLARRKGLLTQDFWFFRPFMERSGDYIGASGTNHYLGNRMSQLIALADKELTTQRDCFWPCRSRSYFIELLLLVNSIYNNDEGHEKVFLGKMTGEIRDVVDFIHINYPNKITMESITRYFHTNKTTMNRKFKEVMAQTVMEYINNVRMQIACSLLRKTQLTVNEIIERVGYRDDSHFLRSFRKYARCTPTEYRSRHASVV